MNHLMSNRLVHVARAGKLIGQFPPEQLASLLDTGRFLESDLCSNEAFPEWTPMPEFLKKIEAPKYLRAREGESRSAEPHAGRRGHRSRRSVTPVLAGWIAFLLTLSALVGSTFWIMGLYGDLGERDVRIAEMERKLAAKEKENQRLLFVSRELAEPGTVRGSLTLRNDNGKKVAAPGIQVFLFPRRVIQDHLEARSREAANLPAGSNTDAASFFVANLPKPIASTTTDASGRFEFPVPSPGEYVLFTSMNFTVQGSQVARIWFVSFNSQDPLNTLVDITETNYVQQFVPSLMIVEGR